MVRFWIFVLFATSSYCKQPPNQTGNVIESKVIALKPAKKNIYLFKYNRHKNIIVYNVSEYIKNKIISIKHKKRKIHYLKLILCPFSRVNCNNILNHFTRKWCLRCFLFSRRNNISKKTSFDLSNCSEMGHGRI